MKRILQFLLLFIIGTYFANGQIYRWSKRMGSTNYDNGFAVAVDSAGNVYSTGSYYGTVDFNPDPNISYPITADGNYDSYIQKLDSSGNFIWAYGFGGNSDDRGTGIIVDSIGNVYTTGYFNGNNVDFDPGAGVSNESSASGNPDVYIHKLNYDGTFAWVKTIGGTNQDKGLGLSIDKSGNIYTTGFFSGNNVDFDPGAGSFSISSSSPSISDFFIEKLDNDGNFVWAKTLEGTTGDDFGNAITIDNDGNVYTTGQFNGTIDFDPNVGLSNMTSAGELDIFVQKLDSLGNFQWAKQMGSTLGDQGNSIVTDVSGNIYTTGGFTGTVDFDPNGGTSNLTSNGELDIFVQKLDPSGNFIWVKHIGGTGNDEGNDMTIDGEGSLYTVGYFNGAVNFQTDAGDTVYLTSNGLADIFVQKLDLNGDFVWVKQMGGTDDDYVESIMVDASDNIYTTGYFKDTVDFDTSPGIYNLVSEGDFDIFVQKLAQGVDNTGPVIFAEDITDSAGVEGYVIIYDFGVTALDDYDSDPTITYSHQEGDTFEIGITEVIVTATDYSNNVSIDTFYISIMANSTLDSIVDTVCLGSRYIFANGDTVNDIASPFDHTSTLTRVSGGDSVIVTSIALLDTNMVSQSYTICEGDSFSISSSVYKTAGIYLDTLSNLHGCDSIVTTNLSVSDTNMVDQSLVICEGDSLVIGLSTYKVAGTYIDTLSNLNSCDSIIITNLSVSDTNMVNQTIAICAGDSLTIGLSVYKITGSYIDTLSNTNSCDSIVTTNLTVNNLISSSQSPELCYGDSVVVGTSVYKTTGVYLDTLSAVNSCDSIVTTNLTVNNLISSSQSPELCYGDSVVVGASVYKTTGVYMDTLSAVNSCDSIVTTNLTVNNLISSSQSPELCYGDSVVVGVSVYKTTGVYLDTLSAVNSCDSIVTTNLTVNNLISSSQSPELCYGDSVIVGTSVYKTTGVYLDTLSAVNSCDSIVTTNLTVNNLISSSQSPGLCYGDSVVVGASVYKTTGVYIDTLSAVNSCDSIVTTNLTVNSFISSSHSPALCYGDSVVVGTSVYKTTGVYMDTLLAASSCDSIVTTNLTVNNLISTSQSPILCYGDSVIVGASVYKTTGVYLDTLSSVNSCDSIVTTNLTVGLGGITYQSITLCVGETYQIGLSSYTESGIYLDTLTSVLSCDSVVSTTVAYYSNSIIPVNIESDSLVGADIFGATFRWIDCDADTVITGEINSRMVITQSGNYALETSNGLCVDTGGCIAVDFIEDFPKVKATGDLYVGMADELGSKYVVIFEQKQSVLRYYLINDAGVIILDVTLQNEDGFILDLSTYPKGEYYLKAEADGPDHIVKIVN